MKTLHSARVTYGHLLTLVFLIGNYSAMSQTIMFDDFSYSGIDDSQLSSFNKWNIISGTSGPPEGATYSRNNISFINDPINTSNKLMTLTTTVNGQSKATTHSRIETNGFEYFEGTYAARVYFSDVPFTYKDANIQTFYTIVSSALAGDGSKYSELDIAEYMAADKWGVSPDNQVLYTTSYHKYIAEPWKPWKVYNASTGSKAGWHTFVAACTDGVNVRYYMDNTLISTHSVTDNETQAGLPVYPRSSMQVAFANWIWNNVTGSNQANRTTTMQVDWVMFVRNQALTPSQVDAQVNTYRSQGLQRRNLAGQTYVTNPCSVVAQPGNITGNTTVTLGSSQTYSIGALSGATSYTWTLPAGWSGSSTSASITTTAGSTGGTISVKANNACGSSTARTLAVTVGNTSENLATNKSVYVSSVEAAGLEAGKAVDGNLSTRWASTYTDIQWLYVDLGANYSINRVKLTWEAAYGKDYQIQVSSDASTWTTIKTISGNTTLANDNTGLSGTGRYMRIYATARGTAWGYSIYELEVYGTPATSGGFTTRIEAENYLYMGGVITESCAEGGQNIGSFDASDWISYNINIPVAGTYKVSYRVSGVYADKTLRLEKDGGATLLDAITIPNTGSWQTWVTVSHNITLPAGAYAIGLTTYTGGLNLNWIEITNQGVARLGKESIIDVSLHNQSVYPNPIKNTLSFKHSFQETATIKILDYTGNLVMNITVSKGSKELNLSNLKSGGYLMKLNDKGTTKVIKIIKE